MRRRFLLGIATAAALTLAASRPSGAGVLTGNCRVAEQPAATLLIPYFEVDLDRADGPTTLFSINNASAKPALARVVLWTDWGVPTLAFDVYLTGYDVQSLNVRDLINGQLPQTGPAVSPLGAVSQASTPFPGCDAAPAGPLTAADHAWLRAAHTGQALPGSTAQCASSGKAGKGIASGYITVDSVGRCTARGLGKTENTPAGAGYFAEDGTGIANDNNVLWGEYFYISPRDNASESNTAVHIVADADFFSPGDYTFYGRYVNFDSRDHRAPLSSLYYTRYLDGGPFSGGTDLVVWRDDRSATPGGPRTCGASPEWAPLGEFQLVVFDEDENPLEIPHSNAFPLATQKVHVGSTAVPVGAHYGWLLLDLWHSDSTHAQGWVGVRMSALGRFSVSHPGVRVDDLCNFGL